MCHGITPDKRDDIVTMDMKQKVKDTLLSQHPQSDTHPIQAHKKKKSN